MDKADKRLPVTEATWKDLGEIKSAGQTWDELLSELIEGYKKTQLIEDMENIRARTDEGDYVPLEELDDADE